MHLCSLHDLMREVVGFGTDKMIELVNEDFINLQLGALCIWLLVE